MKPRKEKITYWLMGLGCGMILSGIVMTSVGLTLVREQGMNEKTSPLVAKQKPQVQNSMENKIEQDKSQENKKQQDTEKVEPQIIKPKLVDKEDIIEEKQIKTYKSIYISNEDSATSITELLQQEKLIEDAKDFLAYIKIHNKQTSLRSGHFQIPEESTYEELLRILLRKSS